MIDGTKHNDVPDITMIIEGKAVVDVPADAGTLYRRNKDSAAVAALEV